MQFINNRFYKLNTLTANCQVNWNVFANWTTIHKQHAHDYHADRYRTAYDCKTIHKHYGQYTKFVILLLSDLTLV